MVSDRPARRRPAGFTVVLNDHSPLSIAAIAPLSQSVASGTNACLSVCEAPKASSATFGRSSDRTGVTIAEVPTAAGGPTWYRIEQIGRWHDAELPDHSSLTRIRKRYGLDAFRRFFEMIVEYCPAAGLIWGKELYFDATQVKANASLASTAPRLALEAHLGELFTDEDADEASRTARASQPIELPVMIAEAEREQPAHTNDDRHDWLASEGAPNRPIVRDGYRRRSDFEASITDPDAALMALKKGGSILGTTITTPWMAGRPASSSRSW